MRADAVGQADRVGRGQGHRRAGRVVPVVRDRDDRVEPVVAAGELDEHEDPVGLERPQGPEQAGPLGRAADGGVDRAGAGEERRAGRGQARPDEEPAPGPGRVVVVVGGPVLQAERAGRVVAHG